MNCYKDGIMEIDVQHMYHLFIFYLFLLFLICSYAVFDARGYG